MRIGLITTINTNIGDDFIRKGICLVLKQVFSGHEIEFVSVNKHSPLTVYPRWHPIHLAQGARYLPRGERRARHLITGLASKLAYSHFDACDLIVQCGTPVLWPNCHRCEWAQLLWHQVVGRLSQRMSVLNLAAGSCYPWERQPESVTDSANSRYLQSILGYCRLTTVRDALAQRLCASLGANPGLIPCSAFLAVGDRISTKANNGPVLINYMCGGGHFDWDQGIDHSAWRTTVKTLIERLKSRHPLAFLCHDEAELNMARDLDPTLPRFWPQTVEEYFSLVSEAKVALCNRMHASVGLAGLGIPSVAVCTDTRLLMVDALELPVFYVKETSTDQLEHAIENLIEHRSDDKQRLLSLRAKTRASYVQTVSETLHLA